jgi:hypothetical protein
MAAEVERGRCAVPHGRWRCRPARPGAGCTRVLPARQASARPKAAGR